MFSYFLYNAMVIVQSHLELPKGNVASVCEMRYINPRKNSHLIAINQLGVNQPANQRTSPNK